MAPTIPPVPTAIIERRGVRWSMDDYNTDSSVISEPKMSDLHLTTY